jgi:multicomponent Na+:H+ antiporter subunit E
MKAKFATFVIMLGFWVVLSGMFDAFHFSLGVICCLLVAHFSSSLLFPAPGKPWMRELIGMIAYCPWLLWQIILANLQVTYLILHPKMLEKIDPHLFRFKSTLTRPIAKVAMAQSITLTPGTITVNIHEDQFAVYALTRAAAESLPGEMERRIARALEIEK